MKESIRKLKELVDGSDNIVFFGGAGVSTESGIPDFRSVDGLYHQQYDFPPETILSHTFYEENPEEFFRFYRNKLLCPDAQQMCIRDRHRSAAGGLWRSGDADGGIEELLSCQWAQENRRRHAPRKFRYQTHHQQEVVLISAVQLLSCLLYTSCGSDAGLRFCAGVCVYLLYDPPLHVL